MWRGRRNDFLMCGYFIISADYERCGGEEEENDFLMWIFYYFMKPK
jgi:hypothetical protein